LAHAGSQRGVAPESGKTLGSILLADHDEGLRHEYASILRSEGYSVITVASGEEGAGAFEAASFDVVVCEVDMPGRTGLHLLQTVRRRDLDIPVVLLTGGPTLETAISAIEHGATRYLTKPVDPQQLKDVLRRAVQASRLARVRRALAPLTGEDVQHLVDLALAARFDSAIAKLFMVYQPIVRWSQRQVIAYEALARSGETTISGPEELFDAGEQLDRVQDIGRRVRSICAVPRGAAGTLLFVNLHTRDLLDESLYEPRSPLGAIAPSVVLEITERARLEAIDDVPERIRRLRAMGFRIALDDLGAGYAGLTSFASLEPDYVKLDMSLVRGIDRSTTKQKLVGSMIRVCVELGVQVVGEGVETPAERDTLVNLGCDLLQGFLLGAPSSPAR
jgi:EAL domain-containing protein (putative c-di-GMP-specific phosphodiesterase class I)